MPWWNRGRRSRSEPYDPVLDSEVGVRWRERSAAVGEALSGISAELAVLPWAWHPDREPRPTKLMIRDQERLNSLRSQRRDNAMLLLHQRPWIPGEVVPVRHWPPVIRRGGPY
jgi:hypothetical protein